MRWRAGLILGLMVWPALARAQAIPEADLLGGWQVKGEQIDGVDSTQSSGRGWLVLTPDHMWGYGGPFIRYAHGGGRWRIIGDTLWLARDGRYYDLIMARLWTLQAMGRGIGVMDQAVLVRGNIDRDGLSRYHRPEWMHLPDAVYWSAAYRDTTKECGEMVSDRCTVWVYKITRVGPNTLSLGRLDHVSIAPEISPLSMTLQRDSLTSCHEYKGGDDDMLQSDGLFAHSEGCSFYDE